MQSELKSITNLAKKIVSQFQDFYWNGPQHNSRGVFYVCGPKSEQYKTYTKQWTFHIEFFIDGEVEMFANFPIDPQTSLSPGKLASLSLSDPKFIENFGQCLGKLRECHYKKREEQWGKYIDKEFKYNI